MTDDEITRAFKDLSIADFLRETSAKDRTVYDPSKAHYSRGRNNFNGFVDAHVQRSRETADAQTFMAFSTLHNPTEQRHFHPDDDETAPQYAARLAREAQEMGATWFFTAMLAPGRAYKPGEEEPINIDPDDPVALEAAIRAGVLHLSVCWYAESIEQVPAFRRSGIIILDDDGRCTSAQTEGDIEAANNPFHNVMGQHA